MCVSPGTFTCKTNRLGWEDTEASHLPVERVILYVGFRNSQNHDLRPLPGFCLNLCLSLVVSFILLVSFFHELSLEHCHWTGLGRNGFERQSEGCLVSHGNLKKRKLLKGLCMYFSEYQQFFQKQGNYCDLDNHPTVVNCSMLMA